jgi:hypothetical protein
MLTQEELFDKYGTNNVYVSPAATDYFDSKIRISYYCEAKAKELLKEYADHMLFPPTYRCLDLPRVRDDGVVRDGGLSIKNEEIEWLEMEYKLWYALNHYTDRNKVTFIVTLIHD